MTLHDWLRRLNHRRLARRKRARQALIDRRWFARDDPARPDVRAALQQRLSALRQRPRLQVVLRPSDHAAAPPAGWPFHGDTLYPAQLDTSRAPAGAAERSVAAGRRASSRPAQPDRLERGDRRHAVAAFNQTCMRTDADALVVLPSNARLAAHALLLVAEAIERFPEARLIYADEDGLDPTSGRRHSPSLHGDWNAELLRSTNYLEGMVVVARAALATAGAFEDDIDPAAAWWSWLLRITEQAATDQIVHIPHVLCHRTPPWDGPRPAALRAASADEVGAVQAHLDRCGVAASARASELGGVHVRYRVPAPPPLVSVIVPTRNGLALLRQCVHSVLERTRYPAYEIVIVDNGSDEAATLEYLRSLAVQARVRVLRDDRAFNFSALNNAAARGCSGSILALLNNDIEVISPDWLDEMVGLASRPDVGAVGARLWFPDGTLQHAGVVLGLGDVAGHLHRQLPHGAPGYQGRALLTQEFSAVTAACVALRREVYERLGGLDEQHLAVDFNDIDFCLRIRRAGYRVVWTPHAELFHHESASRGKKREPAQQERFEREVAYMHRTWGRWLDRDPAYNPNLTLEGVDAQLSAAPRVDLAHRWFDQR